MLCYFALCGLKSLLRDPKYTLSPAISAFLIAFGIALVYGWSTVSVLRRNNASFYFAVILACVRYLSVKTPSNERKKERKTW